MMSSANVDLVRSIYADWGGGDYGSSEWADTEIVFVVADGPLLPGGSKVAAQPTDTTRNGAQSEALRAA